MRTMTWADVKRVFSLHLVFLKTSAVGPITGDDSSSESSLDD
jgi:hypothetical protein